MSAFNYEKDADGIVTVTMDMSGPVNAMNAEYRTAMAETLQRLETETGLKGVVLASAKNTCEGERFSEPFRAWIPGLARGYPRG